MTISDETLKKACKEAMEMKLTVITRNIDGVEHKFSNEFEKNMAELIKIQEKKKKYGIWTSILSKVAAVAVIILGLIGISVLTDKTEPEILMGGKPEKSNWYHIFDGLFAKSYAFFIVGLIGIIMIVIGIIKYRENQKRFFTLMIVFGTILIIISIIGLILPI